MDDDPSPIAITIDCPDWSIAIPDLITLVSRAVEAARNAVASATWISHAEVAISLTDDDAVAALNEQWRGKKGPTNVLSFPIHDLRPGAWPKGPAGPALLGDVVLAFGTVEREARELGKPLADHLAHLIVHGTLHLLGYDHENEADALLMEDLERHILATLGIDDPYAAPAEQRGPSEMAR